MAFVLATLFVFALAALISIMLIYPFLYGLYTIIMRYNEPIRVLIIIIYIVSIIIFFKYDLYALFGLNK